MDQSTLVDEDIRDGRRLLERFAADGHPFQGAFWVKETENEHWFLYVVTEIIDLAGPTAAYRALDAARKKLGDCRISISEIKAIGPNHPVARDALFSPNHAGRTDAWSGENSLGSLAVDRVYRYLQPKIDADGVDPTTTEDLGREILRLMSRGPGVLRPSRITLRNGTSFDGVPFSFQFGDQNSLVVQFVAERETAPRVVRLDEIASVV